MTIEQAYNFCKPFTEKNFQLEKSTDIACQFYFKAMFDISRTNCFWAQNAKNEEKMDAYNFVAGLPPSVNALIQSFVNWAERNPNTWGQGKPGGMQEYNFKTWPCIGE